MVIHFQSFFILDFCKIFLQDLTFLLEMGAISLSQCMIWNLIIIIIFLSLTNLDHKFELQGPGFNIHKEIIIIYFQFLFIFFSSSLFGFIFCFCCFLFPSFLKNEKQDVSTRELEDQKKRVMRFDKDCPNLGHIIKIKDKGHTCIQADCLCTHVWINPT